MKRRILMTLFAMFATGLIAVAQFPIDDRLTASSRRALPHISTNAITDAIDRGLWNTNKTALAIAIPRPSASLLFVFLRQKNGEYLAVDVSGMEGANVGLIGPDRRYDRVETKPLKWLNRDDGLFQIQMRTRAWHSSHRYTGAGTLVIKPDGTCIWQ